MKAYIIEGFLYGYGLPDSFILKGTTNGLEYSEIYSEESTAEGIKKYTVSENGQKCLIKPGAYMLCAADKSEEIYSVAPFRVPTHQTDNGKPLPFTDDVFAVVFKGSDNEISICIHSGGLSKEDIPKIVVDGNEETFADGETRAYTYAKPFIEGDPFVLSHMPDNNNETNGKRPLFHGDKIDIVIYGKTVQSFIWDQISKIWHEKKDPNKTEMVKIKGGTFTMGDFRGKLYNYSFGAHDVNMKKNWEKIYDPQFMGEEARGEAAVGVTGLKAENSLAKDEKSDFWCFNEDAVTLHEVELSDFEIGKYHVTMEQFYLFVKDLKGDSEESLYYEIEGKKYSIHEIAGIGLSEKKNLPRDNGWGLGDRPVVNVSFNEMAEYCNWLSRKNSLTPCYEIKPVYKGDYGEGKSEANVFRYVDGSHMQIKACRGEMHQLVQIICDITANGYRLPTEAEFEYVLRGGVHIPEIAGGKGDIFAGVSVPGTDYNCDTSWQRRNTQNPQKSGAAEGNLFNDNMGGNGYTSPEGTRIPSRLGVYDACGNVWDVVNDIFSRSYFEECSQAGKVTNPTGPAYDPKILSDMKNVNADRYLKGRYSYSYKPEEDGSMTRTGAVSLEASGKTHHVLRGGCHTNPFPFTSSLHRHAAGGISYTENFVNHNNARTGFRLARRV